MTIDDSYVETISSKRPETKNPREFILLINLTRAGKSSILNNTMNNRIILCTMKQGKEIGFNNPPRRETVDPRQSTLSLQQQESNL